MRWHLARFSAMGVVGLIVAASALVASGGGAQAAAPALIQGSGSSWAFPALTIWTSAIKSAGVQVVYNPDGDAAGRQDYANKVSDFAVTSDGYLGFTKINGTSDTSNGRPYSYLPIAAGGTSFPYQIKVDGTQVRNLRLSGQTLAKIFTGVITNWDNSTITHDNNGTQLPNLPIVPVVQSQGSGATEQLTNYFAREYPNIWQTYAGQSGPTEYFPVQAGGQFQPVDGSSGAINYVTSSVGNGAIAYVEYSYALGVNYPVAQLLNSAGYYTLPTKYNVAVSLEAAVINMNKTTSRYLLQTLDNVYTNTDPRTYPLSSYVYMIEPTGSYPNPESKITTGKRQSLADFEYYDICQGQTPIGNIGYSPLPVNLVEAGFGQINKLKTATSNIDITKETIDNCNNPTFVPGHPTENYLAQIAPLPASCNQTGAGPCGATVNTNGLGSTPNKSGSYGQPSPTTNAAPGPGSSSSSGGKGSGTNSGRSIGTSPSVAQVAAQAAEGKKPRLVGTSSSRSSSGGAQQPTYDPATLPGNGAVSLLSRWGGAAVGGLLVVFAVPGIVGYRRARRRGAGT